MLQVRLSPTKLIQLDNIQVSGSNSLSFQLTLAEFKTTITFCLDVSGAKAWLDTNPTLTAKDYLKEKLAPIYDSFQAAEDTKKLLEALKSDS
jgi:hypothetical protein